MFLGQPDGETAIDWYRPRARAAIAAMREPTDAMVSESEKAIFEHMAEARDWTLQAAKDGWRAGIDEALK